MKKLLLLSLLLSACAKPQPDPRSISGIDPAFTSYVQKFESYYGNSIGDIPIQFTDIASPTIGVCTRWTSGERQIVIDRTYWNNPYTSDKAKMGLIFHELGHCALNREHNNTTFYYYGSHIAGDVPYSLMNMYNFYSNNYVELESHYINELFHGDEPHALTKIASDCVVDIETDTETIKQ